MDTKIKKTLLCNKLYFVKTHAEDKLNDDLINFIKECKINLINGEDPVNYISDLLKDWKNQQVNSSQQSIESKQESQSSEDTKKLIDKLLIQTVFIFTEFNGDLFKQVNSHTRSILGLTAVKQLYNQKMPIPMNVRPIHNFCMKNLFICFTNIKERDLVIKYRDLLHYMGGASRGGIITEKITHLISHKSGGDKYRVAITCGIPVMNMSWIDYSWENRFDESFRADDPFVIEKFKLKPFSTLNLAFLNFADSELEEMKELTLKNEGKVVAWDNVRCTHIIIDAIPGDSVELNVDLSTISKKVYLVYKEWFWASLEIAGRADEKISNHAYPLSRTRVNTNHSVCTTLSDSRNFSCEILSPTLDFSTDSILDTVFNEANKSVQENVDYKSFSKRRKICLELLETEKNYLEILRVIVNIFYKPLEEPIISNVRDGTEKQYFLDNTERKIIFGNIPPILETHEGIYQDLEKTMEKWDENCSIGNVFIKYSDALLKAYPPFSNFFENTKDTLNKCDKNYPRFHAFLKKCQSRPECKRQSLVDLLIRPVQRLPSCSLLLNDLLKHTDKHLIDYKQLKIAIDKINEVLAHLNEDKRKTEGQIAMFDIINDIEECPASLLSANRHFLCKSDAKLILKNENKALPMKSYVMTLFLFNDVLEICKKRSIKRSESLNLKTNKTISISSGSKQSMKKSYKHIDTLPLEFIKLIYHFSLYDDCQNAITIVTNPMLFGTSRTYRTYPFVLDDKEAKPEVFLTNLSKQVSNPNIIVKGVLNEVLDIDFEYADQLADKLSKSNFGFAKTKEKITRAFSMKKQSNANPIVPSSINLSASFYTPPRPVSTRNLINASSLTPTPSRRLSRAFSSFMNIGSPLTLSRRQMSTTSLNDMNDGLDGTFSCPTTPAPRKKTCISKE